MSADLIDGTTVRRPRSIRPPDTTQWVVSGPPDRMSNARRRDLAEPAASASCTTTTGPPSSFRLLADLLFAEPLHHRQRHFVSPHVAMIQWVLRTVFPLLTAKYAADREDRAKLGETSHPRPRRLLDRTPAMKGGSAHRWSVAWSVAWDAIATFSGLDHDADVGRPVISYVSRQEWTDHEALVRAPYDLHDRHGVEVNVDARGCVLGEGVRVAGDCAHHPCILRCRSYSPNGSDW